MPFIDRLDLIRRVVPDTDHTAPALVVPTLSAASAAEVDALMAQFITEKYEGAVLRSLSGAYVFSVNSRRSDTALKYKKRDDLEVRVSGFSCGQGRDQDAVVYTCMYQESLFNVVLNCSLSIRKQQYAFLRDNEWALESLKNIPLTIEYSGLSDSGVPQ